MVSPFALPTEDRADEGSKLITRLRTHFLSARLTIGRNDGADKLTEDNATVGTGNRLCAIHNACRLSAGSARGARESAGTSNRTGNETSIEYNHHASRTSHAFSCTGRGRSSEGCQGTTA